MTDKIAAIFVNLDERLTDREFIAAQQFSIADITAVMVVDFARIVKFRPR